MIDLIGELDDASKSLPGDLLSTSKLNEKHFMDKPVVFQPTKPQTITIEPLGIDVSISATAHADIQLFNDEDDVDSDGIISGKTPKPDAVPPFLVFNPTRDNLAYLKYDVGTSISANGTTTLSQLGIKLIPKVEGKASVDVMWYSKHAGSDVAKDAFINDLRHFPFIFNIDSIESLAVGDIVCLKAGLELTAGVSTSWSDVISKNLGSLLGLAAGFTLGLTITPSLKAAFSIKVSGNFLYEIKRTSNTSFDIQIIKVRDTTEDASYEAGVTVGIVSDNATVSKVLDIILKGIFDVDSAAIEQIIRDAGNDVDKLQKNPIVQKIISALKLQPTITSVVNFANDIDANKNKLIDSLIKLAQKSMEISWGVTYHMVEEYKSFLSLTATLPALQQLHSSFLKFDTQSFLKTPPAGATLTSYLTEKTADFSRTTSFKLKVLGSTIFDVGNARDVKTTVKTRYNLATAHQDITLATFDGSNSRTEKVFGTTDKSTGEFLATMNKSAAGPIPLLPEFQYGFQLSVLREVHSCSLDDLYIHLDLAVLWGAIQQSDVTAMAGKYVANVLNKKCQFEAKLVMSNAAVLEFIKNLSTTSEGDMTFAWTNSFASAAAFIPSDPDTREVAKRKNLYLPFWGGYLQKPMLNENDYLEMLNSSIGNTHKAYFMTDYGPVGDLTSASDNINQLGNVNDLRTGICKQFVALNEMINSNRTYTEILPWFSTIEHFFEKRFMVRAFGNFILRKLSSDTIRNEVKLTLTITNMEDAAKDVIVLGQTH
jgi:hypothetical protein